MGMFDLTQEELEEAKSGGFPEFKDGETYGFLIEEIKDNSDKERIEVKTKITLGDQSGKTNTFFYFYTNKRSWIDFLGVFFTEQEMLAGNIQSRLPEIIGLEYTAKCKKSPYKGKVYDNWRELARKSDVPEGLAELETAANEAVSQVAEQQSAGPTVF